MSEQHQQQGASVAPAPAQQIESASKLLQLEDLIPGFAPDGKMRVRVLPHENSPKDGYVTAILATPSPSTVTQYDSLLLGLKGRKGNALKAAEHVIRQKFEDFEGLAMPDELKNRYTTWKKFLLDDPRARPLLESVASQYVRACRVQAEADGDDTE